MEKITFEELFELISQNKWKTLKDELVDLAYADIAEFLMQIENDSTAVKVFRILPKDISADVFAYLEPDSQMAIVKLINDKEIERLMDDLFLDDAVDFLEEVPANLVKRVLENTDKQTREIINRFLKYPENSAGSVMTIEMVELRDTMSVKEAIQRIRTTGVDKETIYTCYVIDHQRHLIGTVPLRKLLLNSEDAVIKDIMSEDERLIFVQTLDDQENIAAIAKKYDLLSIPVVDNESRLVGIITIDDIVDIIDEEATEDFEKMALLLPSEEGYLKTNVTTLAKNRVIWLLILMVSATFTGQIIENFEVKLATIAGLTACIPMLMDTGGNAGNQVSTLVIRGLALGDISVKDYFKILFKEIRVSVIIGVVLAIANFGRMLLIREVTSNGYTISVILVVSLAIMCAVMVAKVIGCSLPILAKILKLDPALMAGPLITTFVDAIALLIYFSLANALIPA